jgi:hypothetical protein
VPTSAPTDVTADTGALGVLRVVGGLVGRPVEAVELGWELVGSDVDVGPFDVGAGDAVVDAGAWLGADVVASEPRDVGVGVLEGGLVGVFVGAGSRVPGAGTPGAVGPPSRLTTSMIRYPVPSAASATPAR